MTKSLRELEQVYGISNDSLFQIVRSYEIGLDPIQSALAMMERWRTDEYTEENFQRELEEMRKFWEVGRRRKIGVGLIASHFYAIKYGGRSEFMEKLIEYAKKNPELAFETGWHTLH